MSQQTATLSTSVPTCTRDTLTNTQTLQEPCCKSHPCLSHESKNLTQAHHIAFHIIHPHEPVTFGHTFSPSRHPAWPFSCIRVTPPRAGTYRLTATSAVFTTGSNGFCPQAQSNLVQFYIGFIKPFATIQKGFMNPSRFCCLASRISDLTWAYHSSAAS